MNPTTPYLAAPNSILHPPRRKPVPKHTQSTNSTSSSSSTPGGGGIGNLFLSANTRRPSSIDSQRSSGEYTAATIYSMYSDSPSPATPLPDTGIALASPSAFPDSRLSLSGITSGHLSVSTAGKHASSTAWGEYHRPTSTAISTPRSSFGGGKRPPSKVSESPEPFFPSPPFVSPATPIVADSPALAPSNALHLLPIPDRLSISRPNSNSHSASASSSVSSIAVSTPSNTGSGVEIEDADSLHVRSTYARLEQSGVPGDGYEEGIERTRARAPAGKERRHTVFGTDGAGGELSQAEIELLSALDRYGFKSTSLSSRQENRLALLPLGPLKKSPAPVKTPPSSPPAPPDDLKALPPLTEDPKELKRIAKWERMMVVARRDKGGNVETWTFNEKKRRKLRERVYKGVPDRWRAAVWWTLIDAASCPVVSPPAPPPISRPYQSAPALGVEYRERVEKPSTHDIQIDLDVPRTISGHVMFHTRYGSGQRSLFHVLHSFSLVCEHCGYCQGMGSIAATLLCYLDAERAYASMIRIHDAYDMHSIFSPGFPGLLESIYVQERLTEKLMPDVHTSFKKHMISSTSYATKWYITLFANTFPFQTQLRLWDAFFLEGRDVMVVIALSIIWTLREHLASAQANFETILSLLSSFFVAESEDALLTWISRALGDKKLRASMVQSRLDWRELVRTGKDMDALL